jgi:hypothetical protein
MVCEQVYEASLFTSRYRIMHVSKGRSLPMRIQHLQVCLRYIPDIFVSLLKGGFGSRVCAWNVRFCIRQLLNAMAIGANQASEPRLNVGVPVVSPPDRAYDRSVGLNL